ncbi:MAG: helix-turn-helix domain-containing protein [Clostridia bacterium]|nr:helix-turn-helix domain-containing protein [Clostridia bacterium]
MFWYNKVGTEGAKKQEGKKWENSTPNKYKKGIVEEYLKGENSLRQTSIDYNVVESTLRGWIKKYSEECQETTGK